MLAMLDEVDAAAFSEHHENIVFRFARRLADDA